jgi:hypothetical protein
MKIIYLFILLLISTAANAAIWSEPVLDYETYFTSTAPIDSSYPNIVPSDKNCKVGDYWRFYKIEHLRFKSRIKFFTQRCI